MADIPLSVLENMSKKDMESFILSKRNHPCWMPIQPNKAFLRRPLIGLCRHFLVFTKYLTEECWKRPGEPYFYRNVMKKVSTKKKKETLAARAENIKQKLFF